MKLIVGLGNPGLKYNNTRHNIGFMVIDNFAEKMKLKINKKKFNGIYNIIENNEEKIILLKPQSYINLSGNVIKQYIEYFKIDISDILIVSDDLDLDSFKIKLKEKGGSGGHNGLKDIEEKLKTDQYKRLKVGISNNKSIETKNYVLGKLTKKEQLELSTMFDLTNSILFDYIEMDFSALMNKYN